LERGKEKKRGRCTAPPFGGLRAGTLTGALHFGEKREGKCQVATVK